MSKSKRYYRLSYITDDGRWQPDMLFEPHEGFDAALDWLKGQKNVRKVVIEECNKNGEPIH